MNTSLVDELYFLTQDLTLLTSSFKCYFTKKGKGGRFFWHGGTPDSALEAFGAAALERERFLPILDEELSRLRDTLAREPRLWLDFQFLVDARARVHHLDLDRIAQNTTRRPRGIVQESAAERCIMGIRDNFDKVLPTPEGTFDWDELDTDHAAVCGNRKCFFHGRAAGEGYLVAKECLSDRVKFTYLTDLRAWRLAHFLEEQEDMRHFLLEEPRKVALPSAEALSRLNAVTFRNEEPDREYFGNRTEFDLCRLTSLSLIVQKVRIAPWPHLVPRCYFTRKRGKGGEFYWHGGPPGNGTMEQFGAEARRRGGFLHTLDEELRRLQALLKREQRLWFDFQFLVDADARIHHIDIDRIAERGGHKRAGTPSDAAIKNCFEGIKRNFADVLSLGETESNKNAPAAND